MTTSFIIVSFLKCWMSINGCTEETPAGLRYTYLNFMPAKVARSFSAAFLRASEVLHGRSPLLALNQVRVLVTDLGELA